MARSTNSKPKTKSKTSVPFGAGIERAMRDRGISYRALADQTGLSAGYLNHLVHGNRPVPSNAVIEAIAKAVGARPGDFREYRIRRISDALRRKPDQVDKLYKELVSR
jgi:transcriptional regulator with XRE-family HTH domain